VSTPNVELLKRTLAKIETLPVRENEQSWDQTAYRCETGMCFAGWTCELTGGQWAGPVFNSLSSFLVATPDDNPDELTTVSGGPAVIRARHRAQRVLGLDADQSIYLFSEYNTLDHLRRIVAELCEQADSEVSA
jgi:hypothetical protein